MHAEPDDAYRPFAGPDAWPRVASAQQEAAWLDAVERLRGLEREAPAWTDMVRRGMLLAAAYQSGAMAGLFDGDDGVARDLVAGAATPASCGAAAETHVLASHAALVLAESAAAGEAPASEAWIRRVHAVACAPQVTHPVPSDHGVHDHVLGHGDYKHHANDVRTPSGDRRAFVPVDRVGSEMARLAVALGSDAFRSLEPVARAAYALYSLHHVGPFAAGNGRVARVIAAVPLLAAGSIPLAVPAGRAAAYRDALAAADAGDPAPLVAFVGQRCIDLVDLVVAARVVAGAPAPSAALGGWATRVQAAHRLQGLLPVATEDALARHRRRTDLGWMAGLADARVVAATTRDDDPRFDASPVAIIVAGGGRSVVQEHLEIGAHPVAGPGDVVVLRAAGAELSLAVRPDDVAPPVGRDFRSSLDALLDRAVTALAVRAAAEDED